MKNKNIIFCILKFLPMKELFQCRLINKIFYRMHDSWMLWQHKLKNELKIAVKQEQANMYKIALLQEESDYYFPQFRQECEIMHMKNFTLTFNNLQCNVFSVQFYVLIIYKINNLMK